MGALLIRIGFPLKGSIGGSLIGFYDTGALIIRTGLRGACGQESEAIQVSDDLCIHRTFL